MWRLDGRSVLPNIERRRGTVGAGGGRSHGGLLQQRPAKRHCRFVILPRGLAVSLRLSGLGHAQYPLARNSPRTPIGCQTKPTQPAQCIF